MDFIQLIVYDQLDLTKEIIKDLHLYKKLSLADELEILSEESFINETQSGHILKIYCKSGNPMAYYWLGAELNRRIYNNVYANGPQPVKEWKDVKV